MFEKLFDDGTKVIIDNGVIALYRADGSQVTNSNVDYYFSESGYGCKSEEEAAIQYHSNFAVA